MYIYDNIQAAERRLIKRERIESLFSIGALMTGKTTK